MNPFTRLVTRQPGAVSIMGTLLALVGAYYSIQLYRNLRTDIEELLPTSARSVLDMNVVTSRLASFQNLVVLISSQDTRASKSFVDDLAQRLLSTPKSVISGVEYRVDREIQFFKDRRALYVDVADLQKIRSYIHDRIRFEKKLYNPLTLLERVEPLEPQLDYPALKRKYEGKVAGYDRFPGGYYATGDERLRAMVIYMPGKGLETAQAMKAAIVEAVSTLKPNSYAPDLEVKFTGNVEILLEESAALIEDLELSTAIVMILVTFAMFAFYRSVWATLALVFSLFMGTFWTFGASYFAVGYLNANTAFLASIVIGNGINFGIIFLARYLEERRQGGDNTTAVDLAIRKTAGSTLTAALAAALSYGSLMLTGFRGFSQFGVIGLIGMVLCWASAYILLPAYLTLLDRRGKLVLAATHRPRTAVSGFIASSVVRFSGTLWLLTLFGIGASIWVLPNYKRGMLETNLSNLRDKRSIEQGAGALYKYIDDIFGHSFSPMVILPKDRESALKIANLLRAERTRQGKNSLLTEIQTLDDFIPKHQAEKIAILKQIKRELPDSLIGRLEPSEQRLARELLHPSAFKPFGERDLPRLVLDRFMEKDGSFGKIVTVDKAIERGGDDAKLLVKFVKIGREITDSVALGIPVAGDLPITNDMFEAIIRDGPRATLFAFLAVVLLVVLLFRDVKIILLVLFALGLGVTWFAGLILGLGLKINFLNFIALPITFGIGIDYGVNVFGRYREEGPGSILNVIRHTGAAVMLCSFTTITGYSSLLIAGNQAFVSFGRLAVLGELACVTAAVISLPAFLHYYGKRKQAHFAQNEPSAPS